MNKPQEFKAKVAEHILINEKFRYIDMELIKPYRIEFKAGQYVSIDIGGGERRSYSVASKPSEYHEVEICVDVSPGGKGSDFLKGLKPGDEVSFMGPLGQFVLKPFDAAQGKQDQKAEKKLLMVATGSGIAPLRSIIREQLEEKGEKRFIKLFWGLRFVEDMFWEEDFRRMHKYFKNFEFRFVLSKPPQFWPLNSGHVTQDIEDEVLGSDWGVYLCGSQAMVKEVSELVISKGVPKDQVHFEKFF
jgi:NAD(P)H-flavin reductase